MENEEVVVNETQEQPAVAQEKEFKKIRRQPKRKVCAFCTEKIAIDYKDVARIKRFITEKGKIHEFRIVG